MTLVSGVRMVAATLATATAIVIVPRVACAAEPQRYALVVEGASGGGEYATLHRQWLDSLVKVLRDTFHFDGAHLTVLAEQPRPGEGHGTAEDVRAALGRLATAVGPDDLLFVMLIGHGGAEGGDAKFNLVGPDLDVAQWAALLKPIRGHLAFVDATSSSYGFLRGLAAPGRVIITATNSDAQRYHTEFAGAFIQALTASDADADKNGRVSLLEAFLYASRLVKQYYEQKGDLSTEHAVFDDTGDGKGYDTATPGQAPGTIAGLTYLDQVATPTSSDPALQQLLTRQQALTKQLDDLQRQRPSMTPEAYDAAFQKLMVELAEVSREIRRHGGGGR
jgi:hypothetical protein